MDRFLFSLVFIVIACIPGIVKQTQKGQNSKTPGQNSRIPAAKGTSTIKPEPSAVPHKHKKEGVYETYSKKTHDTKSGAMPHKHETKHYTSMSDASNLPKGYILLNGEPVRVADLENK